MEVNSRFLTSCYVACVSVISITNWVHLRIWSLADQSNPVCNSTDCRKLADLYLKNMQPNVNPCVDFYEYACHGWEAQHPRPEYEDIWDTERELEYKAVSKLQKLLTDENNSADAQFQQAKMLYKACMHLPSFEKFKPGDIKNIMTKNGMLPMFLPQNKQRPANIEWWQIDNAYIKLTGESALFDINVALADNRKNQIVAQFKGLDSAYGKLKRITGWRPGSPERNHYYKFLIKVIQSVAPQEYDEHKLTLERNLYAVLQFRDELEAVIRNGGDVEYETVYLSTFQGWYDKQVKYRETVKTNWLEVIRTIFKSNKDPNGVEIKDSTTSVMVEKPYFEKLANVLGNTSKRDIVNHIHLYFAERHLILTANLLEELRQSYSNNPEPTGKIRYDLPRQLWCVSTSNMQEVLTDVYVQAVFSKTDKIAVSNLITDAKNILGDQIMESTWLNREWKLKSVEKIQNSTSSIGYLHWMDPNGVLIEHGILDENPLRADAYYIPGLNRLHVSAAFLQSPNYNRNVPYVINYGATTTTIGHELYHALDHKGLTYNAQGRKDWWPKNLITEFDVHSQCFKRQYESQRAAVMKKYKLTVSPPSTVDEDIADVMGLKLAYKGYRQKLFKERNICEILPGFEGLGCEKLFFIAFANSYCSVITPAGEKRVVMTDKHSLPRIRVNGAVANIKEFADVFKCNTGDPLYQDSRCDIWK